MYDDVIFADRFRYPLTILENLVLIRLFRLLHAFIAYDIDTVKIIAAFCLISYCLYDYIWLNSIACRVKTTGMYDAVVFADRFRYQITMFEAYVLIWLTPLLYTHIAYEIVI